MTGSTGEPSKLIQNRVLQAVNGELPHELTRNVRSRLLQQVTTGAATRLPAA